jgi:hypothetical protein
MRTRPLGLLLTLLLLGAAVVSAAPHRAGAVQRPAVAAQVISPQDDGGTAEVGVEWITDWPGTADDRANWYYSATDLYNQLGDAGWVKRFNYGNTNAWERDFKLASLGGLNDSVIDSVDLAMIGTHGSSAYDSYYNKTLSSVYFSTNNADFHLSPGEARRAFGNNDLEWLAFDSCSVLRDDSMYYWHETFDGLHLMAGFANTMYVVYRGDGGVWGDQMQKKGWWIFGHGAKTVTQAWFTAVEDQQPSGVRGRVLAEELDNYNDYIYGQGPVSADHANNGGYWYWDHVSGTPDPLQLTQQITPTTMPVYRVVPRTVDEDYAKRIGATFGLSSTVLASPDGSAFYVVGGPDDSQQLRIDRASGGYLFQNLNELWTDPERPRLNLPTSDQDALRISNVYLREHAQQLPGSFNFDFKIPPTVELEGPTGGPQVAGTGIAADPQQPMNYELSYARTLDIGGQTVSVVGPGSRLKTYIGENGQIIGVKGGWRDVQSEAAPTASVPIRTAEQAWAAFTVDPSIATALPPLADRYDRAGKPAPTLAYYEQPLSDGQSELIPVWVFVADLYAADSIAPQQQANNLVASNVQIYVPAAADADATPTATISSPGAGTVVIPGQPITLAGSASGGTAPYTYNWATSTGQELGSTANVTVGGLLPDLRENQLAPNRITLTVRDANGQTATAAVDVVVQVQLHLPLVAR